VGHHAVVISDHPETAPLHRQTQYLDEHRLTEGVRADSGLLVYDAGAPAIW
jgi:hypothetical protein